ncbi:MAG TPA: MlaD family protein [Gemmatimonadales bacterium]|nr:MlaD family protein [Gemmatimonadales bacterium]
MDLHYKREVTVGALVLVGLAVFLGGTMWLGGRSFARRDLLAIRFTDVGNLKVSSPVKISGVQVGRVEKINFEGVGNVVVLAGLPKDIVVRTDAEAVIQGVGALGDVEIVLNPGKDGQALPKGQELVGRLSPGLFEEISGQASAALGGAQTILNQRTADDLHRTLVAMERVMALYANPSRGPSAELSATLTSLRGLSDRLDSTLANPAVARTFENLDTASANFGRLAVQLTSTTARLDTLLGNVNRGRGTLGQLATDPGLYNDLRSTVQSMRALIDSLQAKPGKLTVQVKMF